MTGFGGFGFSSTSNSDSSIAFQPPSAPIAADALASVAAGCTHLPLFSLSLAREGGKGPSLLSGELYGFTGGTRFSSRLDGMLDG